MHGLSHQEWRIHGRFSLLLRMEQTCKTFPALRAGDMPVSVGNDHRIHDILFPYLHHIEIAAKRFILRRKLLHTGKDTRFPIIAAWATLGFTSTG